MHSCARGSTVWPPCSTLPCAHAPWTALAALLVLLPLPNCTQDALSLISPFPTLCRLSSSPYEAICTLDHPGRPVLACSASGRSISAVWPQLRAYTVYSLAPTGSWEVVDRGGCTLCTPCAGCGARNVAYPCRVWGQAGPEFHRPALSSLCSPRRPPPPPPPPPPHTHTHTPCRRLWQQRGVELHPADVCSHLW